MKIAVASDYAGIGLRTCIKEYHLKESEHFTECFTSFPGNSAKYPDNGSSFFFAVKTREYNRDIPAFGSRNEIFGTTNNNAGIHSTFCLRKTIAELARQHNKVNICELSDRFISIQEAEKIVDIFPDNKFEDGRQQLRPEKIPIK